MTPDELAGTEEMARELLTRGESVSFVARGASMRPFIFDGDQITVAPLSGPVCPGDVVLLAQGRLGVVHRVLWVWRGRIWVKGDALPCIDGVFNANALLGRVTRVRRAGRSIRNYGRTAVLVSIVGGKLRHELTKLRTAKRRH